MVENRPSQKAWATCKSQIYKDVVVSVIQEHKCTTYADFRRINEYAYNQAKKNGWLSELGLIQDNPGKKFWTKRRYLK